jgi:DNA primase
MVDLGEIEDPDARGLFIALEECFVHDETTTEELLFRIDSEPLRNFIIEKGTSKEFSGDPEELLAAGVRGLKKRKLQRRLSGIVLELRNAGNRPASPADESRLEELLSEKMCLDAQIRELEGREKA